MKPNSSLVINNNVTDSYIEVGGITPETTIGFTWYESGDQSSMTWSVGKLYEAMANEPKMQRDIEGRVRNEFQKELNKRRDLIDTLSNERQLLLDKVDALLKTISMVKDVTNA